MKILDKFEEYNNILFIGGSNNNDIITKAQNITANTLIKHLSEESRDYYYDIKHKEQSAPYRQTKRELEKLKTSLNHTIFNDNKDLFNQLKLQESDFQYKEKITTDLETQNALAEEIYAAITYDMEDLLIKFKK